MNRFVGLGNLLQAGIFFALSYWMWSRWAPAGVLLALAGTAQALAGLALLVARREALARLLSVATLVLVAVLYGLVARGGLHIIDRFGTDAGDIASATLGGFALGLPWVVAFPLWQVLSGLTRRIAGAGAGAGALALLVPPLVGAMLDRPARTWPAPASLAEQAAAARQQWIARAPAAPLTDGGEDGDGEVVVLLTPWQSGKAGETVAAEGADLASALAAGVSRLPAPAGPDAALVVDVAQARYRPGGAIPPRDGGLLRADGGSGGVSPGTLWQEGRTKKRQVLPQAWASQPSKVPAGMVPARFDSVVVGPDGVASPMVAGWSAPAGAEPGAAEMLAAALEAGRFLARHQSEDGRYAYVIQADGRNKGGYNFPRHAGTAWFLARLAARTGDAGVAQAADRGNDFIAARTTSLPAPGGGEMAYFSDDSRGDGKVWVGTSALAALALVERDHPLTLPYGRFLAASVDDRGQVLGEMVEKTGEFPAQKQNPYGQGQTLLALATLVRAGHEELRPALERAAAFLDGAYSPGAAGKLVVLDEHWACIAALAVRDVTGRPAGAAICRGYLLDGQARLPEADSTLAPLTGPAGGHAEAVVAGAYLDPDGPWAEQAVAYGRWFLQNAYTPADAPFLTDPAAMMGGFRDNPLLLEVRMDSVQHIGCALLGIEAILSGTARPGSLP